MPVRDIFLCRISLDIRDIEEFVEVMHERFGALPLGCPEEDINSLTRRLNWVIEHHFIYRYTRRVTRSYLRGQRKIDLPTSRLILVRPLPSSFPLYRLLQVEGGV
jgi:hypothetical protein